MVIREQRAHNFHFSQDDTVLLALQSSFSIHHHPLSTMPPIPDATNVDASDKSADSRVSFNTEVDVRTGRQTVVKDVYDVEATDINDEKK